MSQPAAYASVFDSSGAMVPVTGAASGLGLGIAQAFHAAGARVAMGDVRKDAVESAAAGLGGERTFAGMVDVRDETLVQDFFAAAEQALGGPVTITVANAGIVPNCPVLEMSVEEWDHAIETNLRGTFLTCRTAARSMVHSGRPGRIITIASGAHISGRVGASHYSASKAGIVMLTKVLAMELAEQGITVNSIAPGYIKVRPDDPNPSPERAAFRDAMLKNIPM